jgi:hypothetical protein
MRTLALSAAVVFSMLALTFNGPAAQAAPKKTSTKTSQKIITIQEGDSLSKIATANDSTAQRIYDANLAIENPDLIFPGDKVRIPRPDEKLTTRPMPVATPQVEQVITEPVVSVSPTPTARRTSAPAVAGGSVWDQLAMCESGGNWAINTGNGFYGGLQFTLSSWQAVGGSGLPSDASREEQIMRAERLLAVQGWGAWPACTSKLGLR